MSKTTLFQNLQKSVYSVLPSQSVLQPLLTIESSHSHVNPTLPQSTFSKRRRRSCYSVSLRNNHSCVENSMRHHCPICYEYLFDSLKDTTVLKCRAHDAH